MHAELDELIAAARGNQTYALLRSGAAGGTSNETKRWPSW
jgi:hypothetical protein